MLRLNSYLFSHYWTIWIHRQNCNTKMNEQNGKRNKRKSIRFIRILNGAGFYDCFLMSYWLIWISTFQMLDLPYKHNSHREIRFHLLLLLSSFNEFIEYFARCSTTQSISNRFSKHFNFVTSVFPLYQSNGVLITYFRLINNFAYNFFFPSLSLCALLKFEQEHTFPYTNWVTNTFAFIYQKSISHFTG